MPITKDNTQVNICFIWSKGQTRKQTPKLEE